MPKNESSAMKYLRGIAKNAKGDFAVVAPENLRKAVQKLKDNGMYRLICITGVDTGTAVDAIYTLSFDGTMFNLKVPLNHKKPEVESISDLLPAASLYELELMEMLGVKVLNHPMPEKRMFLPEDWKQGPPLRKAFIQKLAGGQK
ncbi:MAG: NADH-quinone oxidoreductase subunit C [archaeon]